MCWRGRGGAGGDGDVLAVGVAVAGQGFGVGRVDEEKCQVRKLLPSDIAVAGRRGGLLSATGRPVPAIDCLLAATRPRELRLEINNGAELVCPGLEVFDLWPVSSQGSCSARWTNLRYSKR